MSKPAILALANGAIFHGSSIGVDGQSCGEVVFNTAMTGYQEIITDPSYARQLVTFTYPHIGNVGVNNEDAEAAEPWAAGLIIRELARLESNWRSQMSLATYLQRHSLVAIADIDTRRLTRILRDEGTQNGCIIAGDKADADLALAAARQHVSMEGLDLAQQVTTAEIYTWTRNTWQHGHGYQQFSVNELKYHVVVYDFGAKHNILSMLVARSCRLTVIPATTSAEDVLAMQPDGIFLSNGPGDPAPCDYAIAAIKTFLEHNIPLFGVCLGHQLLALAVGANTIKMKFGHHGANHPVQDLESKRVYVTSQNHGFAVDEASLPQNMRVTHRSLFDGSLQGIEHCEKPAFGFQGHPEASPGPQDISLLFDKFVAAIAQYKAQQITLSDAELFAAVNRED